MRGVIRPTTAAEAVARGRRWAGGRALPKPPGAPSGTKMVPLRYRLKAGFNGGKDPLAAHPGMPSYGDRTWTADCFGFVAWALGFDRYQVVRFPLSGGWLNTDSAVEDAKGRQRFFAPVAVPKPGDIVVYGRGGGSVGHVGLVTTVPAEWDGDFAKVGVVHCSGGHDRKLGYAIAEDNAKIWAKRGMFLRYVLQAPTP